MKAKAKKEAVRVTSIAVPEGMYLEVRNVAADRLRRGEIGSISGAFRELTRRGLDVLAQERGESRP